MNEAKQQRHEAIRRISSDEVLDSVYLVCNWPSFYPDPQVKPAAFADRYIFRKGVYHQLIILRLAWRTLHHQILAGFAKNSSIANGMSNKPWASNYFQLLCKSSRGSSVPLPASLWKKSYTFVKAKLATGVPLTMCTSSPAAHFNKVSLKFLQERSD